MYGSRSCPLNIDTGADDNKGTEHTQVTQVLPWKLTTRPWPVAGRGHRPIYCFSGLPEPR